jgi:hypothetical protein
MGRDVARIPRRGRATPQRRAGQLLRRQLQGQLPSGLLSDARHSGLVQPRIRQTPTAARRGRSALRPHQRHLEPRRQISRLRPSRSARPLSRRGTSSPKPPTIPNETHHPIRPLPHTFQRRKGRGTEPIAGASKNGMSNSFPKISPDGKWLVFTQAKNGLLMRPTASSTSCRPPGGKAAPHERPTRR